MDEAARLDSVDNDPTVIAIARKYLGSDRRVTFHVDDGAAFIERQAPGSYDFVFADAWPGKFTHPRALGVRARRSRGTPRTAYA
jgi:spermidine synthase